MDAPSPPRSPSPPSSEQEAALPVIYKDREFYLSEQVKQEFLATANRRELNKERIANWLKQIGEGRFTVYGLLLALYTRKMGRMYPWDHQPLKTIILDGGTQVARLLAEEGHWLAAESFALQQVGFDLFRGSAKPLTLFERVVNEPAAVYRVKLGGNALRAFVALARRTKGARTAFSYVRKDLHPVRELQEPPRLLRWNYTRAGDYDDDDAVMGLDAAISIGVNALLIASWAGLHARQHIDLMSLYRLVGLYGTGLQRQALQAVSGYIRLNKRFMATWTERPDPGPGAVDLTDRADAEMASGGRPRKRRKRAVRYSEGKARDMLKDAELAQTMALRFARWLRPTTLRELQTTHFNILEIGSTRPMSNPRGILLEPWKGRGWAKIDIHIRPHLRHPVLLAIYPQALVGLGYYTIDDDVIAYEIDRYQEKWIEQRAEELAESKDLAEDAAYAEAEAVWGENRDDPVWIAENFSLAYFVFYDDVRYWDYQDSIQNITYWDQSGMRYDVLYRNADLCEIARVASGERQGD